MSAKQPATPDVVKVSAREAVRLTGERLIAIADWMDACNAAKLPYSGPYVLVLAARLKRDVGMLHKGLVALAAVIEEASGTPSMVFNPPEEAGEVT